MSDASVDWGFIGKVLERYPDIAYLASDPEILNLLVNATKEEWSPEVFQGRLQQTNYWRNTAPQVRAWAQIEANDPAQAVAKVNETKDKIAALAVQYGGSFDVAAFGDMWWRANREGWSEQQLRMAVANVVQPGTQQQVDVNGLANAYMIDLTDAEAADYSRRLFTGEMDEQGLRGLFTQRASSRFPSLAELINTGVMPGDYFADYRTMIARMTDQPAEAVDLIRDPEWSKILSFADDKGKVRPMTLDETTRLVRGTDRFANSTTGKAESADYIDTITKTLGTRR